jgi:hypothetical protein
MLGRLISWCVPDSALELRGDEVEVANLDQALAPYEHEAAPVDRFTLRVVGNQ